jgi:GTP-binding protein Era
MGEPDQAPGAGAPATGGFRSGVVAVVGRPNVGKSTLVNALVGEKVSIVSDKPQTTRSAIRGVMNGDGYQVVFTDTPGYHKPRTALGDRLNRRVDDSVEGVDAIVLVVDASGQGVGRGDAFVADRELVPFGGPRICVVNKVDVIRHPALVVQLEKAAALAPFDDIVPVSARTRRELGTLRSVIVAAMPQGPRLFPGEETTDQPLERRIEEIVREKALALTKEEVPHSVAVRLEELTRDPDSAVVAISCDVLVERESQKGILIGKGGEMLGAIGTRARKEIEALLGSKVYLRLHVKVLKDWQRDPTALDRLGL